MRKWLETLRANPWLIQRLVVLAALVSVGAVSFCWGRHTALTHNDGQTSESRADIIKVSHPTGGSVSDYQKRVVAYIYDDIPVSREELGEYLIERFGHERVEFLINRKIVDMACKAKGIVITDAEVNAQLKEDIKSLGGGVTEEIFVNQVLKRHNKTLYEYKEDMIRPKLAMMALVKPTIMVTPADVQNEFESRYGPRVQCRMIVLQKEVPETKRVELWDRVRKSEEAFLEEAGKQFIPELASRKGEVPPIHKHFPDANIEKEAFSLKPGDVSAIIKVQDGSQVILRCDKHVPEDLMKRIEDERGKLIQEIEARKVTLGMAELIHTMRRQANPRVVLTGSNPAASPALSSSTRPMAPVAN